MSFKYLGFRLIRNEMLSLNFLAILTAIFIRHSNGYVVSDIQLRVPHRECSRSRLSLILCRSPMQ